MLTWLLSLFNLAVLIMALLFAYESHREGEARARKIGLAGAGFHFLLGLAILFLPVMRGPLAWFFLIMLLFSALLLISPRKQPVPSKGPAVIWPVTAAVLCLLMNET